MEYDDIYGCDVHCRENDGYDGIRCLGNNW